MEELIRNHSSWHPLIGKHRQNQHLFWIPKIWNKKRILRKKTWKDSPNNCWFFNPTWRFNRIRLNQTWCQTAVEAGNATLGVKFLDDLHKGSTLVNSTSNSCFPKGEEKQKKNFFQWFEELQYELLFRVPKDFQGSSCYFWPYSEIASCQETLHAEDKIQKWTRSKLLTLTIHSPSPIMFT